MSNFLLNNVKLSLLVLLLTCFGNCQDSSSTDQVQEAGIDTTTQEVSKKRPLAYANGKIFTKEGRKYMYGGEQEHEHFDITNCSLNDQQFHYGIGREKFPALIEPKFITLQAADSIFEDEDRFILLKKGKETKAYSIKDLTRHEVVNDKIDGEPVMAVYCILADLGAVYHREIGGRTFTFALTGYTYFDEDVWDGMDGFVFWDRETESMWWPLIGESVSGTLKGTPMQVMDEVFWSQTSWKEIRSFHPQAQILEPDQEYEPPTSWPKYQDLETFDVQGQPIAPKWGENRTLGDS